MAFLIVPILKVNIAVTILHVFTFSRWKRIVIKYNLNLDQKLLEHKSCVTEVNGWHIDVIVFLWQFFVNFLQICLHTWLDDRIHICLLIIQTLKPLRPISLSLLFETHKWRSKQSLLHSKEKGDNPAWNCRATLLSWRWIPCFLHCCPAIFKRPRSDWFH